MSATLNSAGNPTQGVYNALIPKEGPKAYPIRLDFAENASFEINLLATIQQGYMSFVQSIFIDNSENTESVSINTNISFQKIVIPPNSQAYLPILLPNQPILMFASAGSVVVNIQLLNIPTVSAVWGVNAPAATSGGPLVVSGGLLQVADPILDGIVTAGRARVLDGGIGNGDVVYSNLKGTRAFQSLGIATTGAKTIITGNPSWFVTDLIIDVTGNFAPNAAGTVITFAETGTGNQGNILTITPTALTIGKPIVIEGLQLIGMATATSKFTCSINNAPVTGSINVTAFGGTTAILQI